MRKLIEKNCRVLYISYGISIESITKNGLMVTRDLGKSQLQRGEERRVERGDATSENTRAPSLARLGSRCAAKGKANNKPSDIVESALRKMAKNAKADILGYVEQRGWGHYAVA